MTNHFYVILLFEYTCDMDHKSITKDAVALWPDCEESACLALLSLFCNNSNLDVSVFQSL